MDAGTALLAIIKNAEGNSQWREARASELDPLINACRRGATLAPKQCLMLLEGVQQGHRRDGEQWVLVAAMLLYILPVEVRLPWWRRAWLRGWAWWVLRRAR